MVRYRLAPDDLGPFGETLTDVVGVLEEWSAVATVLRASGERITVPLALIVAAKVLPPAPERRVRPPSGNNPPS